MYKRQADLNGLTDGNAAGVRRNQSGDDLHECGLSAAVRADDADALIAQYDIGEVSEEQAAAEALGYVLDFDGLLAHAAADGIDLYLLLGFRAGTAL